MQARSLRYLALFARLIFIPVGALLILVGGDSGVSCLNIFLALFLISCCLYFPRYVISPTSVVLGYYALWYVLAAYFAEIYSESDFSNQIYAYAYAMAFSAMSVALISIRFGEELVEKLTKPTESHSKEYLIGIPHLILFYFMATILVVAIVLSSGGFSKWILDPGDAFLNRGGSGVFVVLSHFFTFCLAISVGQYSFANKSKPTIAIFIFWLVLTSPVHGSKWFISVLFVLALMPWLRTVSTLSFKSIYLGSAFVGIFFAGLYFRNSSWMTLDEAIPYALNYFTVVRNLVMSIEDYSPDLLATFLLPFNKFLTPFGLTDASLYYDMNHMLTDKYFPTAWEIRATEQWPVETDLYLNFYFIFGLPLLALYFGVLGFLYKLAHNSQSVGVWAVSFLLIVSIISHLRGSLINHVDLYMYPMMVLIYFLFKNSSFRYTSTRNN